MVDWSYFDKFEDVQDKYLPSSGEGNTMAEQIVTSVSKLIYKWYNDGDVYDNTYSLEGWCNDLSDYANWLYIAIPETKIILNRIESCYGEDGYSEILKDLADKVLNEDFLSEYADKEKFGTIYDCEGKFTFEEYSDEEEDW